MTHPKQNVFLKIHTMKDYILQRWLQQCLIFQILFYSVTIPLSLQEEKLNSLLLESGMVLGFVCKSQNVEETMTLNFCILVRRGHVASASFQILVVREIPSQKPPSWNSAGCREKLKLHGEDIGKCTTQMFKLNLALESWQLRCQTFKWSPLMIPGLSCSNLLGWGPGHFGAERSCLCCALPGFLTHNKHNNIAVLCLYI